MKKTNLFKLLMAMAVVLTLGVFASCGDDDPDPTPTPPAKATSCTRYYVEAFSNVDFNYVDMKRAFYADGDAETYTSITRDGCSGLEGLSSEVKTIIQTAINTDKPQIANDCSINVIPVTVNIFPKVFNVKYQFSVKSGYVPETKQNFGIYTGYLAVTNTGAFTTMKGSSKYAQGIQVGKEANYLTMIAPTCSNTITVKKDNGAITVEN